MSCSFCFREADGEDVRTQTEPRPTRREPERRVTVRLHVSCLGQRLRIEEMGREFEEQFPNPSVQPAPEVAMQVDMA